MLGRQVMSDGALSPGGTVSWTSAVVRRISHDVPDVVVCVWCATALLTLLLRTNLTSEVRGDVTAKGSASPMKEELDPGDRLISAASSGDLKTVRRLLRRGAKINGKGEGGDTALVAAAREGRIAVVRELIAGGAAVDERDDWKSWTALIWAARRGHMAVAHELIQGGAAVNGTNEYGETALSEAIEGERAELVEMLTRVGGRVSPERAFRRAIWQGDAEAVRTLILRGVDVDKPDREGDTPLMAAANAGPAEIVLRLIEAGADVHAAKPMHYPDTAVGMAIAFGHDEAARLLRESGADISPPAELRLASNYSRIEGLKELIRNGVDLEAADEHGRTALMMAAAWSQVQAVCTLLEAGADANGIDADGSSALIAAAAMGEYEPLFAQRYNHEAGTSITYHLARDEAKDHDAVVHALIRFGANVNVQDKEGWTALMWEAKAGHVRPVQDLLAAGADLGLKNRDDRTVLQIVRELIRSYSKGAKDSSTQWWRGRHEEIAQILEANRASLVRRNN